MCISFNSVINYFLATYKLSLNCNVGVLAYNIRKYSLQCLRFLTALSVLKSVAIIQRQGQHAKECHTCTSQTIDTSLASP